MEIPVFIGITNDHTKLHTKQGYRAQDKVAPIRGAGETIHLHCTDGDGEWLVRLGADGVAVTNEHAKGDVAARGTASDLMLLVWGRIPPERVDVFGDAALLTRWQELTKF